MQSDASKLFVSPFGLAPKLDDDEEQDAGFEADAGFESEISGENDGEVPGDKASVLRPVMADSHQKGSARWSGSSGSELLPSAVPTQEAEGRPGAPETMQDAEVSKAVARMQPRAIMGKVGTARAASFTVGELMLRKNQRKPTGPQASDGNCATPEDNPACDGKSPAKVEKQKEVEGWNILSRRFHVTCALNSLSSDLKNFGAQPQERAVERQRTKDESSDHNCCILRPDGQWYMRYQVLSIILLVYCAFVIPVRVSFDFELSLAARCSSLPFGALETLTTASSFLEPYAKQAVTIVGAYDQGLRDSD